MLKKLGLLLYLVVGLIMLGVGLRYYVASDLMAHHVATIGVDAASVPPGTKRIIFGLYSAIGAASISMAVGYLFILYRLFRTSETWARWALSVTGLSIILLGGYPTLQFRLDTGESSPALLGILAGVFVLIAAHLLWRPNESHG